MADEDDVDLRDPLQHLVGPDAVERGEPGEKRDGDLQICSVTPVVLSSATTRKRRPVGVRGDTEPSSGKPAAASRPVPKPQRLATTSSVSSVVSSSRRAASRRTRSTNRPGVSPTSAVKTRVKWRTLMAAAAAKHGKPVVATGRDLHQGLHGPHGGALGTRHPHR